MMEAVEYPVILHIYELTIPHSLTATDQHGNGTPATTTATASFLSNILKPLGFGTYHTSLEINGYCYTFSAVAGIQKSKSTTSTQSQQQHVPPNTRYKQSITLGNLSEQLIHQHKINTCITKLRNSYFTNSSYHLACRNCNHFTETLAMALFLVDGQLDMFHGLSSLSSSGCCRIATYPQWVNRLAKTSTSFAKLKEEDGFNVCDVVKEARDVSGFHNEDDDMVVVVDDDDDDDDRKKKFWKGTKYDEQKKKKKTLTEAQKMALAKLRKK